MHKNIYHPYVIISPKPLPGGVYLVRGCEATRKSEVAAFDETHNANVQEEKNSEHGLHLRALPARGDE